MESPISSTQGATQVIYDSSQVVVIAELSVQVVPSTSTLVINTSSNPNEPSGGKAVMEEEKKVESTRLCRSESQ